jgi:hypothetical protein
MARLDCENAPPPRRWHVPALYVLAFRETASGAVQTSEGQISGAFQQSTPPSNSSHFYARA